jgi:hypothetical protein
MSLRPSPGRILGNLLVKMPLLTDPIGTKDTRTHEILQERQFTEKPNSKNNFGHCDRFRLGR